MDFHLDEAFELIDPLAIKVYGGKQVLFLAADYYDPAEGQINPIWNGRPRDAILFPESTRSIDEQRNFVSHILHNEGFASNARIVVITGSPVVLSDAFNSQIWIANWRQTISAPPLQPVSFSTFGAEPGLIALRVFGLDESIGTLADKTLNEFLHKDDWTIEELESVVRQIGGGWPRAKLREMIYQIKG